MPRTSPASDTASASITPPVVTDEKPKKSSAEQPEVAESATAIAPATAATASTTATPTASSTKAANPATEATATVSEAPATAEATESSSAASLTPTLAPNLPRDIPVEPLRRKPLSDDNGYMSPQSMFNRRRARFQPANLDNKNIRAVEEPGDVQNVTGILDTSPDGHGVLRVNFAPADGDAYISSSQVRRFRLRPGDLVTGPARAPKDNERYWGLLKVDVVNGTPVEQVGERVKFQSLTPVYPNEQIKLETGDEPLDTRIIDMVAPIGKGQRSLIVSPPKAGKTNLLMSIATGIAANHPEIHMMAVLVGERPEEVTEFRRHIHRITKGKGEVAASNFDEPADDQCRVAEIALERAKRMVELGTDVVILLDSITRLARAYNLSIPTSGRTLSGGFDPAALFPPKKFFGAARNFEVKGSLTIIGTALVDTGSRMDDLVYEEFKGTGNQEVHLERRLAERRIFPAIDVQRSGTRRDDYLIDGVTYQSIMTLHRMLDMVDREERTQTLIERLKRYKTNKDFLASLKEG